MNGKSFIIKGRKMMSNLRIRPHSEEAEAGVIGSVLLDPSCMDGLSLKPEEFYDRRHSLLWESLQEMHVSNRPLDAITVMEWLKDKNLLDRVGGHDYLLKLQDDTLVSAHSQHYAGIVSEKARLRSEIDVLSDGLDLAYKGESASDGVLAALSSLLVTDDHDMSLPDLGHKFIDDCKEGTVGHFGWWCHDWTYKLGKMSSDLVILHAPRSTGKTAMMLQWITEAHKAGQNTPLASIEMLKAELVPRFIAHIGQVSTFTMKVRGSITPDEEAKAGSAVSEIRALQFTVRDKGMTIDDIRAWAISENKKRRVDAVFVDNLLSISDGGKQYQSKTIMYDDFIRKFRDLRDVLQVPVIILAHPNKEGGLAWSTDVENFADIIIFLIENTGDNIKHKGGYIPVKHDLDGKHIIAKFQKHRQGIRPFAHLDFIGSTQTFRHIGWIE
jgi:replicative DNA helicase